MRAFFDINQLDTNTLCNHDAFNRRANKNRKISGSVDIFLHNLNKACMLDEATQSLRVAKATIRRRIKRDELHAIKKRGPNGEQYFVPRNEILAVQAVTDVIPVTRQVNLLTLRDVIEQAVLSANESLKKEFMERINKVSIEIASIKQ
jgi:CRISPR/Cas system CMR subunit Cmr4 (Cas7 group RAMP superfamily)